MRARSRPAPRPRDRWSCNSLLDEAARSRHPARELADCSAQERPTTHKFSRHSGVRCTGHVYRVSGPLSRTHQAGCRPRAASWGPGTTAPCRNRPSSHTRRCAVRVLAGPIMTPTGQERPLSLVRSGPTSVDFPWSRKLRGVLPSNPNRGGSCYSCVQARDVPTPHTEPSLVPCALPLCYALREQWRGFQTLAERPAPRLLSLNPADLNHPAGSGLRTDARPPAQASSPARTGARSRVLPPGPFSPRSAATSSGSMGCSPRSNR
jgi:hypothetical protein